MYLISDLIYSIDQTHFGFPHYNNLDQIWWDIPGFDSNLISSNSNVDYTQHLLSLVQIGPNEKIALALLVFAWEENKMNVKDQPQNNTSYDNETANLTGLGDIDDRVEQNLFDNDMQVNNSSTWWFILSEVARNNSAWWLPVIQVDGASVAGIPQAKVSIKHVGYCLCIKQSL